MTRLFHVSIPTSILLMVLADTVVLFGCYILAGQWALYAPETYLLDEGGWAQMGLVVLTIQIGLYFNDLYDVIYPLSRSALLQQLCVIVGAALLVQASLSYFRLTLLSKWTMIAGSLTVLVVFPLWRKSYQVLIRTAIPAQKILFLGSSPAVHQIANHLRERPEIGLAVLGYLSGNGVAAGAQPVVTGLPMLGSVDQMDEIASARRPDRIVVSSEAQDQVPIQSLLNYRFSGKMEVEEVATLYESVLGRVSMRDLRPSDLLYSFKLAPNNLALQKIYSPLIGLVGLILSLPIMAIVALLVKLSSPGPVLFRQTRVGLHGVNFDVFKFRTMYADAEAHTGAVWASRNDPRVTRIGVWLRRLRLDELPQFFNVVRGQMSIVGPRPERPEFSKILEEQIPLFRQRQCVKPGLTGWAQINYKYGETIEDARVKLEYDLYYIKHLSPALDAYIIFHTLKIMLLSRGAQ